MSKAVETKESLMSSEELRKQLQSLEAEIDRKNKQERKNRGFWGFSEDSFFNFGHFWSSSLLKLLYFCGFVAINGILLLNLLGRALGSDIGLDLSVLTDFMPISLGSLGDLLVLVVAGLAANILWRLLCEVAMIPFRLYELLRSLDMRLGEIQDKSARG